MAADDAACLPHPRNAALPLQAGRFTRARLLWGGHHQSADTVPTNRCLVAACLSAALGWASPGARAADADTFAIDPVHTRVLVAVSHAGFSSAIGTVSGTTGTLIFDRDNWASARLDVRVPVDRLDFGDAKWNMAALAASLLDGARHPEARFVSTTVQARDANHAQVCGALTLRGVSRPLCMDVALNALKRHPMPPFRRTAGFSATATLSRSDYGIDAWKSVIGDTVEIRIEAEAVRRNPGNERSEDPAPRTDGPVLPPAPPPSPPNAPDDAVESPAAPLDAAGEPIP